MLWRVTRICRAALDLLTVPGDLEERAGIPLLDDAYDTGSDRSSQSCVASPRCAHRHVIFRLDMDMGGRRESVLVWDEKDDFNVDEESERLPHERWEERLVLGSGWLYKQDLKIENLKKQ